MTCSQPTISGRRSAVRCPEILSSVHPEPLGGTLGAAVWRSALGTLVLGVFPSLILNFAGKSALLAR